MAESSITHNFIITDPQAAERLAKALEESSNDPPRPISDQFRYLQDPDELKEFMQKVKHAIEQRQPAAVGELQANAEEGSGID